MVGSCSTSYSYMLSSCSRQAGSAHLRAGVDAVAAADVEQLLDGLTQRAPIREMVVEHAGRARVGQQVRVRLRQVRAGERPVIQRGACEEMHAVQKEFRRIERKLKPINRNQRLTRFPPCALCVLGTEIRILQVSTARVASYRAITQKIVSCLGAPPNASMASRTSTDRLWHAVKSNARSIVSDSLPTSPAKNVR